MGECNNCHNITCPFYGQCRSEQGNYTCLCPARSTCSPVRVCYRVWYKLERISLLLLFRMMIPIQFVEVINNYFRVSVKWIFVHVNYKLIFTLLHLIIVIKIKMNLVKQKPLVCSSNFDFLNRLYSWMWLWWTIIWFNINSSYWMWHYWTLSDE
jgi:hypothetical protein